MKTYFDIRKFAQFGIDQNDPNLRATLTTEPSEAPFKKGDNVYFDIQPSGQRVVGAVFEPQQTNRDWILVEVGGEHQQWPVKGTKRVPG